MNKPDFDVSYIVVTRNEEKYIEKCLRSLLNQHLEGASSEIIVVDGESSDSTVKLARELLSSKAMPYTILQNPGYTLAKGWNIGIKHSKGRYLIRPDAHAELHPEYTLIGLRTFTTAGPETGVIGGRLETKAVTWFGEIISAALSSRLGVGNSSFRTSDSAAFADTAVYGIYKQEVFEKAGYFDENLIRHQDTAFHYKLHINDIRMYFNPSMKAVYFCRETLKGIAKQMYLNGYHLSDLIHTGIPNSIQPRHMAPFLFFSFLLLSIISGLLLHLPLLINSGILLFAFYFGFLLVNSISVTIRKKKLKYMLMAPVISIMHLSYAYGSLRGIIKFLQLIKNRKVKHRKTD